MGAPSTNSGRSEVAVDDLGYLILNDQQPYSIEIASPTRVETFVLWFPQNWAEEVLRSFDKPPETLLVNPSNENGASAAFFERYTPHNHVVSPKVHALRAAFKGTHTIEDAWLEEKLRELLAAMLASQQDAEARESAIYRQPRNQTREGIVATSESGQGLSARASWPDRSHCPRSPTAACLSPFHLLRVFRSAFGQTPHQYLNHCRLERGEISSGKNSNSGDRNLFGMRFQQPGFL
jgi:hypothetical protein